MRRRGEIVPRSSVLIGHRPPPPSRLAEAVCAIQSVSLDKFVAGCANDELKEERVVERDTKRE